MKVQLADGSDAVGLDQMLHRSVESTPLEIRLGLADPTLSHVPQVICFGLNRMDIMQRKGGYPLPPGASSILGVEFSGTVEEPGESEYKKGDEVCVPSNSRHFPGFAEHSHIASVLRRAARTPSTSPSRPA